MKNPSLPLTSAGQGLESGRQQTIKTRLTDELQFPTQHSDRGLRYVSIVSDIQVNLTAS